MLRIAKAVLVSSALLCYTVLALCGQGLHCLPGCGHDLCCDCDHAFCDQGGKMTMNRIRQRRTMLARVRSGLSVR